MDLTLDVVPIHCDSTLEVAFFFGVEIVCEFIVFTHTIDEVMSIFIFDILYPEISDDQGDLNWAQFVRP